MRNPFVYMSWFLVHAFYRWASSEIPVDHPDLLKVNLRRRHYAELLGFRDVPPRRRPARWLGPVRF